MIYGNTIIVPRGGSPTPSKPESWAEVQSQIQQGLQPYEVGEEINIPIEFDDVYENDTAICLGYDNDHEYTISGASHSMLCQFKHVLSSNSGNKYGIGHVYDYRKPMCILNVSLNSGTYYFTMPDTIGGFTSGTYKFTTSSTIPTGAHLSPRGNSWTDGPIMYWIPGSSTIGLAGMASSGQSGLPLSGFGTLSFDNDVFNASIIYGTSHMHEWLNGNASFVCNQGKIIFANDTMAGVYGNLKSSIKNYIANATIPYATSLANEMNKVFTSTTGYLFLPRAELSQGYYTGDNVETLRIRYDAYGTARGYPRRSPALTSNSIFSVTTSGNITNSKIKSSAGEESFYIVPFFIIA